MEEQQSKSTVDELVKKALSSLRNPSVSRSEKNELPEGMRVYPYSDLVGTYNIVSANLLVRIIKKPLSFCVLLYRKIFQDYLDQRTRVDGYLVSGLSNIKREVLISQKNLLESTEAQVRDVINRKLDEKVQETHILIDRFKKEINFELVELRKSGAGSNQASEGQASAKVLNPEKLKKIKKVNIGAGMDIRDDYINVDHRELEGIDVVADVLDMPFKEGTIKEVFASHVVEHFVQRDLIKILRYWFSLLEKGGALRLILPNIEDMTKKYASGDLTWEEFRSVALGGQDYKSDYHYNHFSVESMRQLVQEVIPEGTFRVVASSRRNGECYEMEVLVINE